MFYKVVIVLSFLHCEGVFCSIKASCELFCFVLVGYHGKTVFVLFIIGDEHPSEGCSPVKDKTSVEDESVCSTVIQF